MYGRAHDLPGHRSWPPSVSERWPLPKSATLGVPAALKRMFGRLEVAVEIPARWAASTARERVPVARSSAAWRVGMRVAPRRSASGPVALEQLQREVGETVDLADLGGALDDVGARSFRDDGLGLDPEPVGAGGGGVLVPDGDHLSATVRLAPSCRSPVDDAHPAPADLGDQ